MNVSDLGYPVCYSTNDHPMPRYASSSEERDSVIWEIFVRTNSVAFEQFMTFPSLASADHPLISGDLAEPHPISGERETMDMESIQLPNSATRGFLYIQFSRSRRFLKAHILLILLLQHSSVYRSLCLSRFNFLRDLCTKNDHIHCL